MQTVRDALEKKLRMHEKTVAQLRGKMARLEQQAPDVLNVEAEAINVHAHSRGVSITIFDKDHEQPRLPSFLLALSNSSLTPKRKYDGSDDTMEYFSFDIAGINVDLDRKLHIMKKCRKARVEQVIDVCGDPGSNVHILEWIDE